MANETNFIEKSIQIIVPQPCFDEFFVKFNFFEPDCMKLVLSKCLGFAIILGSVMVKIPQLVKIINNQSAQGISLMAVLCELFAVSATTVYSFAKSFPFSSYGEGLFLVIQTSLIAFCVLFYNGNLQGGLGFLAVYIGLMVFLMSSMAPMPLLSLLQSSNIPIAIISKLIQAVTNVRNGGTGQLSVVTVFLLFAGSIARIFTSIQETGDSLVVATYVVSTACNGLIFAQILYYWNAKPKPKRYTPPSQCKALSSNLSEYDIGLTGNVSDFRIEYGKCDLTIHSTNETPDPYHDMKPRKFDCLNGYHFDHSEGETVTMEFGLICGKSGLGEFSTTMVLVGMCLGAAIFPSLSDRFGRKTVAVVTHVFMLAANLALAFMPNLASFATFRTIIGTLQQGLGLSTAIIHVEIFPMEWRGFLGFTGSVNWSLCVCSLALFGYLMRNLSWRYLQLALSLVSFHALFGPWILDESLRWLIANNKNTKAVRLIEKAARWNKKDPRKILSLLDPEKEEMLQLKDTEYKYETIESKAYVPTSGKDKLESVSEATITEKYSFLDILKNRVLLRNSLILWYTWAVNSGTYYGLFLTSSSLSFGNRYLNYFINGLVEIPAALAYFAVINRIGRKYTCVLFHGLAGVSLILSVALLAATKEDGDAAAIASTIFSYSGKLGISASFLTIFMYTPELYPTNLRNVGIGIASATGRIGGMMSPYSSVLMQYAIWAPGVLFGSCCLVAMVLMFFLPETGGYILPQTIEEMEKWTKEQSYFRPYKNKQQLVVDDEKRKTDE